MNGWDDLCREEGWNGKQAKVGGAVSASTSFQRMSPAAAKCNLQPRSNHNIRNHHLMPVKVCFLLCWHPFLSCNWKRWENNLKFYLSWHSSSDSVPVSRKAKRNPTEGETAVLLHSNKYNFWQISLLDFSNFQKYNRYLTSSLHSKKYNKGRLQKKNGIMWE